MKEKPYFYGGQAVIEGVMMRGRNSLAIAVRKQDGSIVMREDPIRSAAQRFPVLKYFPFRGVVAMIEALVIGIKALNFSAQQFAEEEEEEIGTKEMVLTMGFAFLLAAGLFIGLPALLIQLVQRYIENHILLNLVEGLIKIGLFLAYIWGISFMADIRRVFEYHGAEHKAINCYESGKKLTVANVKKATRFHKRCGTSFIVFVLIISILLFSFFGKPPFLLRILYHLLLLPLVAGISYEIIRWAGRDDAPRLVHWLSLPGIWTQKITTREPDDQQIEVAIASLEAVLATDKAEKDSKAPGVPGRHTGVEGFAQ